MKTLAISVLLGVVALAIAGYLLLSTEDSTLLAFPPKLTVDALFTTIILLTMAGIFFLNAALQMRAMRAEMSAGAAYFKSADGLVTETGTVEAAQFYEAVFPNPNKTIVTFADAKAKPRLVVFQGNVRDQLPPGTRVRVTYRPEPQGNVLLDRERLAF